MNILDQSTSETGLQCQAHGKTDFSGTPGLPQPVSEGQFTFECVFYYAASVSVQADNAFEAIEKARAMNIEVTIHSPDDPEASIFYDEGIKPQAHLVA
ncbi:MAG: hypothetical protein ACTS9Y_01155 [Methylophilus sp.]|uniref:hypothetical protein n=1 Tax=Methylophilus sp. TaxID=29541 RepID=UPI003FA0A6E1